MKHSILAFVVVLFAAFSAKASLSVSEGCFLMESVDDLYEFNRIYNSDDSDTLDMRLNCVKLTRDIVVNENVLKEDGTLNEGPFKEWEPIRYFRGTFDGQNHTISGLYQMEPNEDAGFFLEVKGLIKNMGIVDSYFGAVFDEENDSKRYVGSFSSYVRDTLTIENCYSSATIEVPVIDGGVGGLIGGGSEHSMLTIRKSHNEGRIVQSEYYNGPQFYHGVGGLVGSVIGYDAVVRLEDCYNKGNIISTSGVGGLAGTLESGTFEISRCYNLGELRGSSAGGLIGEGIGLVNESFNSGVVTGSIVGGLVGSISSDTLTITNSYNRGNVIQDMELINAAESYYGNNLFENVLGENRYSLGGLVGKNRNVVVQVSNSYSASKVVIANMYDGLKNIGEYEINALIGGMGIHSVIKAENVFYLKSGTARENFDIAGVAMLDESPFYNGTVAMQLHQNYEQWGQKKTGDGNFPDFSGSVKASVGVNPITWNTFEGDTNRYPANYVEGVGLWLPVEVYRKGYLLDGWYTVASPTDKDSKIERIAADETGAKKFYAKWWQIKEPPRDGSCYLISNVGELYSFAAIVNGTDGMKRDSSACGKLTQDIVVNEQVLVSERKLNPQKKFRKWIPMENFYGIFDGDGHVIYGLYFEDGKTKCVGFFGKIGAFEIKNLGLEDFYFKGAENVGAFVGYTLDHGKVSLITNSYSSGVVVVESSVPGCVGGFVGFAQSTVKFSGCRNKSVVYGGSKVGGFVGLLNTLALKDDKPSIRQSYNEGRIYGRGGEGVGGLVGVFAGNSGLEIKNAYNIGPVQGSWEVGGILGEKIYPEGDVVIYNTYNAGKIIFSDYGGAIVGETIGPVSKLDNCFYLEQDTLAGVNMNRRYESAETDITAVDEMDLYGGSVAAALRGWKESDSTGKIIDGEDGLVWAEAPAGTCALPHFVWQKDDIWTSSVCLQTTPVMPKRTYEFRVSVVNRNLQVEGARAGDRYVLFDMQGHEVLRGTANSANFSVAVPAPGNFVLRIGRGTRKVTVGY